MNKPCDKVRFGMRKGAKNGSCTHCGVIELYKNGVMIKSSDYNSRQNRSKTLTLWYSMVKNLPGDNVFCIEIKSKNITGK